jgi:8-oxo-dGTP diphosphatase
MDADVARIYGNRVRVRACGLCWQGSALLMVNHHGLTAGDFWSPPGGGVEFGNSVPETLEKEFLEETGLKIRPGKFRFGCEFIQQPIHSIELFYEVTVEGGKLITGRDPEIQIIEAVRYMDFNQVKNLPVKEVHGIFRLTTTPLDLKNLSGFYRI